MWIRYANTATRRVVLRDDDGAMLCDVSFDEDGRARCRKNEAKILEEHGYVIEKEKEGAAGSADDDGEQEEEG